MHGGREDVRDEVVRIEERLRQEALVRLRRLTRLAREFVAVAQEEVAAARTTHASHRGFQRRDARRARALDSKQRFCDPSARLRGRVRHVRHLRAVASERIDRPRALTDHRVREREEGVLAVEW